MIPDNALDMIRELYAMGAVEIHLGELRVVFPPRPLEIPASRTPPQGRQLSDQEEYVLAATASST